MMEKRVGQEQFGFAPCRNACPAGVDVPRYVRCIQEGKLDEALAVIRERLPLPLVCGYACYAPCELNCGNQQFGDAVSIRALKRTAAELGGELWRKNLTVAPSSGKKVAVVGAGPSGLTAAYYLAVQGHKVTVFEAEGEPGGMLRWGIPAYRLPKQSLSREIDYLKELGVEIKTNSPVDSVDALKKDFDAVYLACGAQKGAGLGVDGENLPGVIDGIAFLKAVNQGQAPKIGSEVAVIGGGNTAVDAARSALRVGAGRVTVFYRRTENEMTAYEEEVEAAREEGVVFRFLATPVKVDEKDGKLWMTLTEMKLGRPDKSGRPRPEPVPGGEFADVFDNVIAAIGQKVDLSEGFGVNIEGGQVKADLDTLATDKDGVYAGGDVVTGPASIIDAVGQGRKAAQSIDKYLGGEGRIDQELAAPEAEVIIEEDTVCDPNRVDMPCLTVSQRYFNFEPVEEGYTARLAQLEAARCRACDHRSFEIVVDSETCKECGYCRESCGLGVFEFSDEFNKKGYRFMTAAHPERCVGCGMCFYACPDWSVSVSQQA